MENDMQKAEVKDIEQTALETGLVEPEKQEMDIHVDPAISDQDQSVSTALEVEGDQKRGEKKMPVTIDARDYGYLKKNNYEEERKKWKTTFVLQHKRYPDKIVELRAATPAHACRMIHWKPNQVRLLSQTVDESGDVVDNINKMMSERAKRQFSATALV